MTFFFRFFLVGWFSLGASILPANAETIIAQTSIAKPPAPKAVKAKKQAAVPGKIKTNMKTRIGQMVMIGFSGTTPKARGVRAALAQIAEGTIGGVIIMKHNVVSMSQLQRLTHAFYAAARKAGRPTPFIGIDQEGGAVQRLKFHRYPTAKRIAGQSTARASAIYARLACEVRRAGINVNFGPVLDLDISGRANPIIGRMQRSYGKPPQKVALYAARFIAAHKRFGLMTTAKHFPGHGSSLHDSHRGFTAIPRWKAGELAPYKALAQGPADTRFDLVMIGHLFNKKWGAPASLSQTAVTGLLRQKVGFKGLAITDDMEMGAIRKNYKWRTALLRAIKAGNDIVLYSNTVSHTRYLGRKIVKNIFAALCSTPKANQKNCVNPALINAAYNRIMRAKRDRQRLTAFNRAQNCRLSK